MQTLSLLHLRRLLARAQRTVIDADLLALLDLLSDRDWAMNQADAIESVMLRHIGSPTVIIMVGNQATTVASQTTLDGFVNDGVIGLEEAERLGRRLSRRWQQWWEQASIIGLRGLRRRERRYANQASKVASRILQQRADTLNDIKAKLALLCATPTIESNQLLVVLDDLTALH